MNKAQKQEKAVFERKATKFIAELTALTRKHGIAIGGCGCCGSPFLMDAKAPKDPTKAYLVSDDFTELRWR